MRILYHHRTLADGAEGIHIAEMVNAFRKLGHEVLLIGPGTKTIGSKEMVSDKFKWVKRLFKGPLYEVVEIFYNVVGYRSLVKAIKSFKPDFVYDRYITFNYSAVAAARRFKLPIFLEVNAPIAYERHTEPDETLYLKKIAFKLEKKVCCDATQTIVVSTPLKAYLISIGVPGEKIAVLPNGVNTDTFFPRGKSPELMRKLLLNHENVVIGFIGILRQWHGIDILLDAFKTVSGNFCNCKLLLVGDGPMRDGIQKDIETLALTDKVTITGRIDHSEVPDYVALFDIAVSPRATFYASPMKIIEYMALEKAVVAPDMPNIRDLIKHDGDGVLFKPGDAHAMAEALNSLLVNVPYRKELGRRASATVKNRLNWQAGARFVLDAFNQLQNLPLLKE